MGIEILLKRVYILYLYFTKLRYCPINFLVIGICPAQYVCNCVDVCIAMCWADIGTFAFYCKIGIICMACVNILPEPTTSQHVGLHGEGSMSILPSLAVLHWLKARAQCRPYKTAVHWANIDQAQYSWKSYVGPTIVHMPWWWTG